MTTMEGRVVLITGGASGIGAATADLLAGQGANVWVLDMVEHPELPTAVADVTSTEQVNAAVQTVVAQTGRLDGLVNCAGAGAAGTIDEHDDDVWVRLFNINVIGAARVSRAALPHLRKGGGSIVNVCSIAATAGLPNRVVYSSTKGGLLAFTRALAADYVSEGVTVNAVSPGTVDTPWVQRLLHNADAPDALLQQLQRRQPTGRLVSADEVANSIAFLLNPAQRSITGISLEVDGGMANLRVPYTPSSNQTAGPTQPGVPAT